MAAKKRTPELENEVLARISKGETLRSISEDLNFHRDVWLHWCEANPELKARYREARERGADAIAEECVAIADNAMAINEHISKAKLRIDTRLKLLAKWQPKTYGEKSTVDVGNKDGEALKIEQTSKAEKLVTDLVQQMRAAARAKDVL